MSHSHPPMAHSHSHSRQPRTKQSMKSLLLLALVGGAHAIPTMLKEDAAEATRRRAWGAAWGAVAGSGSGSGSGSAGPKPDDFDPKSPLTSYIDHHACGPRGDDAQADTSACPDGRAMVIKKQNFGKGEVVHTDVDGCEYFVYTIYECELKAEIRPADASGSGSGSGSGSASGPGSGSGSDKAGCDGVANSWKAMGFSAVLKNLNPRLNAAGFFTTKSELQAALTGDTSDIENWDVSLVEDFSYLFYGASSFNADLSKWNVAKGTDFKAMFAGASSFNADLSKWDVAQGTNFDSMVRAARPRGGVTSTQLARAAPGAASLAHRRARARHLAVQPRELVRRRPLRVE